MSLMILFHLDDGAVVVAFEEPEQMEEETEEHVNEEEIEEQRVSTPVVDEDQQEKQDESKVRIFKHLMCLDNQYPYVCDDVSNSLPNEV